jgi:hypothetical protein
MERVALEEVEAAVLVERLMEQPETMERQEQ